MQLPALQTPSGGYTILALDRLRTLSDRLRMDLTSSDDVSRLDSVIKMLARRYTPDMSGLLLSPQLGFSGLLEKAESAGPLLSLERRFDEADPLSVPILQPQWGVEAIRNNYAVAKLELYYHPLESEAQTKLTMLAELYDYCQHEQIDLLVELMVYVETSEKEYKQIFPDLQLQAVRDVRKYCSILALEYPLSALSAVTLTAELDVPWILNCSDGEYEVCKEQLRTCLDSGAKGFLALEQFLPVFAQDEEFSMETVEQFVEREGRDRLLELSRIVEESVLVEK